MDKKEARNILGISKDASKNDIEKRYSILLKKYRMEINRRRDAIKEAEEQEETINAAPDTATDVSAEIDSDTEAEKNTDVQISGTKDSVISYESNMEDSSDQNGAVDIPEGQEMSTEPIEAEFSRVTEAYNVLMGYEIKETEELPGKSAPLFKMVGVNEKKAKNFLYYYKYHILGVIFLIASIIYIVQGCVNRVTPDFNAAFIGRIGYYDATKALSDSVKANIPIITEPGFDGAYFDDNTAGDQLYAMEMKLTVLFGAADIDVFILDRKYYERFAKQGLFMNLDEIGPQLGADVSKNQELIVAIEEIRDPDDMDGSEGIDTEGGSAEGTLADTPEEPHLYGIDVTNSTVLKEAGIIADDMVAAIFLGTEKQEKAEAFLKFLLK